MVLLISLRKKALNFDVNGFLNHVHILFKRTLNKGFCTDIFQYMYTCILYIYRVALVTVVTIFKTQ